MNRILSIVGTFGLAYVAASAIGLSLPVVAAPLAIPWLATGVYVGSLASSRLSEWPIRIGLAALVATAMRVWWGESVPLSAGLAAADTAAGTLAAWAFVRASGPGWRSLPATDFGETPAVLRFFAILCVGGAALHATIGVAAAWAGAVTGDLAGLWFRLAVSHMLGLVLASPLWLIGGSGWRSFARELTPARRLEAAAAFTLVVAALAQAYWTPSTGTPRGFTVLPPLLWLTLRFRVPGAALGMLVASIAATAATHAGLGLYADVPFDRIVTGLPGLLVVCSLCFITLGAAATQVRRTSRELDEANRRLADEVDRQSSSLLTAATRLRLAIDGAGMGTWQWTVGTSDSIVDARQRELLGLAADADVTHASAFGAIHPDDMASMTAEFEQWLLDGGAWEYEHRIIDPDGRIRWVGGRAAIVAQPDGSRLATGVSFDITRQRLGERGRRRAERQVRQLADIAPATLWATQRTGATTFRSRDWYLLTGLAPEDESGLGFGWLERVHEDDRDAVRERLIDAHRRRDTFTAEYRLRTADGRIVWVLDNGRPFVADDGVFQGLVGSTVETTLLKKAGDDQRRAQAALRESDERFRQLADHLDAGLWIVDASNRVRAAESGGRAPLEMQYVSSGFQRVWNIPEASLEARGRYWSRFVHAGDRQRLRDAFDAFLAGRADYDVEYRIVIPSGELRWVHERAYTVSSDEHGGIVLVAGLTIDVTERHMVEEGRRDADRQKDAFLAMLAHELRNPLAPIRTAVEVLGAPNLDEASRRLAREIVERQVVHITRLVDDLLDVSRLSRGRLVLQRAPVDLAVTARQTVADYARFLDAANLVVHLDVPEEPVFVDGDGTRLAQVLGNLLHNVRKFTPPGGVVRVALARLDNGTARLEVEDNGSGITADLLPRIFEPFSQAGQTLDRSPGGLGLGLALVKGLVELHEGTVAVSSAGAGCGTRFDVVLPTIASPTIAAVPGLAAAPSERLSVLVVEDNRDAAETLRLLLEIEGHRVSVAHTAHEGIELALRDGPDLVLCDIGLPGELNGLDLARRLRHDGQRPRLVALTGYAGAEHVRSAEEAGFDRHVTKPVGADGIRELIVETARVRARPAAGATPQA